MARLLVMLVLALMAAGANAAAADTIRETVAVGAGGTLELDTDLGAIDIDTGAAEVGIEVTRRGKLAGQLDVQIERRGSIVAVTGRLPQQRWSSHGRNDVRFRISVPDVFDLVLRTGAGSIRIGNLQGNVSARTAGGSIDVGEIYGVAQLHTAGGSVAIDQVSGDLQIETAGGSIDIGAAGARVDAATAGGSIGVRQVRGPAELRTAGGSIAVEEAGDHVLARTAGGSVRVKFAAQPGRDSKLSSGGGTITVLLPDFVSVSIDATTHWGDIGNRLRLENVNAGRGYLRGDLNGGGPTLRIRGNGDIGVGPT